MDLAQLAIRITAILLLIVCLDTIVYLIALRFNFYYRRKISPEKILRKKILKGLNQPASKKETAAEKILPPSEGHVQPHLPMDIPSLMPDGSIPSQEQGESPSTHAGGKSEIAAAVQKFKINDRVELFGSRGEIMGCIISCNDNNSKSEYRHLVDWGKNGIWWVSEDQIEPLKCKSIEATA